MVLQNKLLFYSNLPEKASKKVLLHKGFALVITD